jgi:hypothetical protein
MACTDVAKVKAKAIAINLIIFSSIMTLCEARRLGGPGLHIRSPGQGGSTGASLSSKRRDSRLRVKPRADLHNINRLLGEPRRRLMAVCFLPLSKTTLQSVWRSGVRAIQSCSSPLVFGFGNDYAGCEAMADLLLQRFPSALYRPFFASPSQSSANSGDNIRGD